MNCKNCEAEIALNYCPNCGQAAKLKRIDWHYIQHEIEHVLHFDKGILYTIKELLIRPGKSVRDFIGDNRSRLVKPIIFIIITSLIYSIIEHFFHLESSYINAKDLGNESIAMIFKWMQNHYGYANIIMGICIALMTKIFFKKYGYNFYEILILLCFVMGVGMLIFALFAIFEGILKVKLMQVSAIIAIIYTSWAIGQFFENRKIANFFKAFFAYLLGYLTFVLLSVLFGVVIDLIIKH